MNTRKRKERTYDAKGYLDELIGTPMTFGSMLHSIRLGEEESQAVFAQRLGLSSSHLCDIEKGRKIVSPKKAVEYAGILKNSKIVFLQTSLQDQVNQYCKPYLVKVEKKSAT